MEGFLERFLHFLQRRDSVREDTKQFLRANPELHQKINANLDLFIHFNDYIDIKESIISGYIPNESLDKLKNTYLWGQRNYAEIYDELAGAIMLWFQGFYVYANRTLRTAFEMLLRYLYHVHIDPLRKTDGEKIIAPYEYRRKLQYHPNFQTYDKNYHLNEELDQFYEKLSAMVHGTNLNASFEETSLFICEKYREFADNLVALLQYHTILLLLIYPTILQIISIDTSKMKKGGTFSKDEAEKLHAKLIQEKSLEVLPMDKLEFISKLPQTYFCLPPDHKTRTGLSGTLSLKPVNEIFCFIKIDNGESFFCLKADLPPNTMEGTLVFFDAMPAYDKKKKKESWKAVNIQLKK